MKSTAEQIRELQALIEARRVRQNGADRVLIYVPWDRREPLPEYDGGPVVVYDPDLEDQSWKKGEVPHA